MTDAPSLTLAAGDEGQVLIVATATSARTVSAAMAAAAPALLEALETLLPFAATAPDWATRAAKDAIAEARGEAT